MAKSVNKVILLGNVGKDPEIRSTPSGTMVASFGLATSDRYQDPQGNWQDRTEWHNLVAFKRTAEIVRDYVKKGSKLYVEGKLQTRSWDDKETGQKRYKTEDHRQRPFAALRPRRRLGRLQPVQLPAVRQPALTSARPPATTTPPNPPKSPTTIFRSKRLICQRSVFEFFSGH